MQRILLLVAPVYVFVSGCASGPCAELLPPAGATQQSIAQDVKESFKLASAEVKDGTPLDEDQKRLLDGQCTKGFVRQGRPFMRRKGDLVLPAASASAFVGVPSFAYLLFLPPAYPGYGPVDFTDRYVAHLMERGYRWAEPGQPAGAK